MLKKKNQNSQPKTEIRIFRGGIIRNNVDLKTGEDANLILDSSWLPEENCRLCSASIKSTYHILSPWLQHTAKEP